MATTGWLMLALLCLAACGDAGDTSAGDDPSTVGATAGGAGAPAAGASGSAGAGTTAAGGAPSGKGGNASAGKSGSTAAAGKAGAGTAGTGGKGGSAGTSVPDVIDIEIWSVLVGLGKADSTEWDGFGKVDPKDAATLAALLGAGPFAPVAGFVTSVGASYLSKPDPFGTASVNFKGAWELPVDLLTKDDTFTPDWGGIGWAKVPYSSTLRVRLTMQDEDISAHDAMGTFEINASDIAEAWSQQKIYQVPVSIQTYNQVLFVGISVTKSP